MKTQPHNLNSPFSSYFLSNRKKKRKETKKSQTESENFHIEEMASQDQATAASDLTFPAADVDKDLSVQNNKSFEVDTISSEVATSLEIEVHTLGFLLCFDFDDYD